MDMELNLTVEDVLKRPLFQGVRVLAGEKGLNRRVRWVHILDVPNFEQLIYGEELILTTGQAFKSDTAFSVRYLEQLIKQNASCLCIELGHSLDSVPEQLIEAADAYQLPLILFPGAVRFVDITQDLHSLIINRHYNMLQELESISRKFHRLSLTSQPISGVLKQLHVSTAAQVVYIPVQGNPNSIPAMPAGKQKDLMEHLSGYLRDMTDSPRRLEYEDHAVIVQPVGALGRTWAYLILMLRDKPQQFDHLILDSASLWIAQELLRTRYIEERKLYTENLWVDDLLHARLKDEEQLKSLLGTQYKKLNEANYRVCVVEFEQLMEQELELAEEGADSIGIHLSLVLRPLFEQHFFFPFITMQNNRLVVVAVDLSPKRPAKARLEQVFDSLLHSHKDDKTDGVRLLIGIGRPYTAFMNAHYSYQEALHALSMYPCFDRQVLVFDELGVFQLFFNMKDRNNLEAFVKSYLEPVIEYDLHKGGDLLRTLKVYLDHDGSKQIAAQKLYIVRQSLYYRLEKIAELLGDDFMRPENRLALQVALRAYLMLNPEIRW